VADSTAGNWVDRGESPDPTLVRILGFYLDRHLADDVMLGYALAIRGMTDRE